MAPAIVCSGRHSEIDMLRQYLVCTRSTAGPVQFDVRGASRAIGRVGIGRCSARADGERIVERCFPVQIPDQTNHSALSPAIDVKDNIQLLIHLKGGN